jgi:uncharacterized protein
VRTLDRIRAQAAEIRQIAAAHGARNVRVVGSVARGTDRPQSDLDLLVTFDPGVGLLQHSRLVLELERLLGRKVDVASERGLRPAVLTRLEADAQPLRGAIAIEVWVTAERDFAPLQMQLGAVLSSLEPPSA